MSFVSDSLSPASVSLVIKSWARMKYSCSALSGLRCIVAFWDTRGTTVGHPSFLNLSSGRFHAQFASQDRIFQHNHVGLTSTSSKQGLKTAYTKLNFLSARIFFLFYSNSSVETLWASCCSFIAASPHAAGSTGSAASPVRLSKHFFVWTKAMNPVLQITIHFLVFLQKFNCLHLQKFSSFTRKRNHFVVALSIFEVGNFSLMIPLYRENIFFTKFIWDVRFYLISFSL